MCICVSSALKIAVDITLARTIEEWEKYSEYLVEFLQVVWVAVAVIMSLEIHFVYSSTKGCIILLHAFVMP